METHVDDPTSRDVESNDFLQRDSTKSHGLPRPLPSQFSRLAGISPSSFFRVPPTIIAEL